MTEDTESTRPLQPPDAGRDTEPVTAYEEPSQAPAPSAGRRTAPGEPPPGAPPPADRPSATAPGEPAPGAPPSGDRPSGVIAPGEPAPGAPPPGDRPPGARVATGSRSPLAAPAEALRQPESRAWLLLAAAALSLVNLVLLIAVLAAVTDDVSDRIVEVEGQRCLVVEEEDANILYCQR